MPEKWEVNHIGEERRCPTCGHSLGISGSSDPNQKELPLTPDELRIVEAILGKEEDPKPEEKPAPPTPPPCGEMDVWVDDEDDVQENQW